ncbi:MAG: hypothetical protein FJX73_06020 [Armatimonadetes bacterium]|nr:hypothetical protein [Armatimonadota bacterium]
MAKITLNRERIAAFCREHHVRRMERELSFVFGGRKIDLRTPEDLSRYFREDVLKEAQVQYAEG